MTLGWADAKVATDAGSGELGRMVAEDVFTPDFGPLFENYFGGPFRGVRS